MRIMVPVGVGLVVISCATSAILWNARHSDRQLIDDLRVQLSEARTALAARPVPVAATTPTEASPLPAVTAQVAEAAPAVAPAKITREQAMAALNTDSVKRQKTLLADPEYRKALLAQARSDIQQHYVGLAVELGLSNVEVNALFDLLAETQVKAMTSMAALTGGGEPDATARAEMQRQMLAEQQRLKDQITAILGPERTAQFEEYDRIEPARTRVNNLANLLGRSGQTLTDAQRRSLTAVMVAEQNRMEAEAKALRDAGKTQTRSQADIQAETNRRILEQVPGFLNAQQVRLVRGRFEQRATIDRASDQVQQRERAVLQETPD